MKFFLWKISPERMTKEHWQTVFAWMKEQRPEIYECVSKAKILEARTTGTFGIVLLCFDTQDEANATWEYHTELNKIFSRAIQTMRVDVYTAVITVPKEPFVPIVQEISQKIDGRQFELGV